MDNISICAGTMSQSGVVSHGSINRVARNLRRSFYNRRWFVDLLGRTQLVWAVAGGHTLRERQCSRLHSYRIDVARFTRVDSYP